MEQATPSITNWRKSSRSLDTNCVEIGSAADGTVGVRDSKNTDSPVLTFSAEEWDAFLLGAKNGEFDRDRLG